MKGDFDWGNLVPWARNGLKIALDAEFSIPDERARELLAQMAETGTMDWPLMELGPLMGMRCGAHPGCGRDGGGGKRVLAGSVHKSRDICREDSGESLVVGDCQAPSDCCVSTAESSEQVDVVSSGNNGKDARRRRRG